MPTRQRFASVTVAALAKRLGIATLECEITDCWRWINMTALTGRLAPMRTGQILRGNWNGPRRKQERQEHANREEMSAISS